MDLRPNETSRGSLFNHTSHLHDKDYLWRDNQIPIDLTSSIIISKKDMPLGWRSSDDLGEKENSNKREEFAGKYLSERELRSGKVISLSQGIKKKEIDYIHDPIKKLKNKTTHKKLLKNPVKHEDRNLDKGSLNSRDSNAEDGPKLLRGQQTPKVNMIQDCKVQNNKGLASNDESKCDGKAFQAWAKEILKNYDKSQLHYKNDGTLDKRFNTSKEYLRLLEIVGEKEEAKSIPFKLM